MKVKCESNSASSLPERLLDAPSGFTRATRFHLTIGSEYVVYGLTTFLGDAWYYICDDSYSYYPVWNPAILFTITDDRISRFWRVGYRRQEQSSDEVLLLAFPEWTADRNFYERLTDKNEEALTCFKRYKEQMDREFF